MNKKIFLTCASLIISTALVLAGCSSTSLTASANSGPSTASKYAFSILELEGSGNAVTVSQAKQLLTLWEGYQSLSSSDTASQVELDALVKQIGSTLTSDQVTAIEAMDLTEQAVSEGISALGAQSDATASLPAGTLSASAQNQSGMANGSSSMPFSSSGTMSSGGPGGVPPSGSGGRPAGGDSSCVSDILNRASTQGTAVAMQSMSQAASVQVNPLLLRAVVQLLETRSQSAG